jgi:hypothetical protein
MAESSPSSPSGAPGAKDELALLDILKLLIETKKARTTADLLKYAGQYGAPEAVERLKTFEVEGIPLDLAFDALSAHLRILAHKRNSSLVADCRGKKVGLVLPLPPHVPHLFTAVTEVVFMQPEEGVVHGGMHEFSENAVKGARACRARLPELQVLVFEAFREENQFFLDLASAEILEPKLLPAGIRLIAHLRPHKNPRDIAYQPPGEVAFI